MTKQPPLSAFSQSWEGLIREIITNAGITEPILGDVQPNDSRIHKVKALWDTGATNSVISPRIVDKLNLKPIAPVKVTHGGGQSMRSRLLVDLYLPNNIRIPGIYVTNCDEKTGTNEDGSINFDLIIGMDVIVNGDFTITNHNQKTLFSFQIPSSHNFDFVKELKQIDLKFLKNLGRNALCPCNSGKKIKACHGKDL